MPKEILRMKLENGVATARIGGQEFVAVSPSWSVFYESPQRELERHQSISHWGIFQPRHEPELKPSSLEVKDRMEKLLHPICHAIVNGRV